MNLKQIALHSRELCRYGIHSLLFKIRKEIKSMQEPQYPDCQFVSDWKNSQDK